uniref:Fibrinogen C-terminal domain-containing protein n=1 Tax=Neogobius melanostomus TaxID=47308 RepID=A0A8C6U1Z8_9GOBI
MTVSTKHSFNVSFSSDCQRTVLFQPVVLLLFLAPLLSCCRAEAKPVDCSDIFKQNPSSASGVYSIYPFSERFSVQAYCDRETDGGGWTVIQRRMDGTVNFYRGWDQYVAGFGDAGGEYWLGLMVIHRITAKRPQELLVEMEDFEGNKASARYSSFSVGSECDGYKLTVSGFTDGGAGQVKNQHEHYDLLKKNVITHQQAFCVVVGDSLTQHSNLKFSTFDKDQDVSTGNCAKLFLGAFWFGNCHNANLNGVYRWGADSTIFAVGVEWLSWKGHDYSLKSISFKTRPV